MQKIATDPLVSSKSIVEVFRSMYRKEGFKVFYRGIGAVVIGAGPAHALYFASYEHSKKLLGAEANKPMATATAAICATVAHDSFMNPIDGEDKGDLG